MKSTSLLLNSTRIRQGFGILEGGQGSPHRDGAHVPGQEGGGDLSDHILVAQGIAKAQTGQSIGLGKRARDDDILVFLDQAHLGHPQAGKFNVRLVDNQRDAGFGNADEVLGIHEVAGRVIRVGDGDDLGLVRDRLENTIRIEMEILILVDHGDGNHLGAQDGAAQLVNAEARGHLDDFITGIQKAAKNVVVNFAGAIAQSSHSQGHPAR